MQNKMAQSNITSITNVAEDAPAVEIDKNQMKQVLLNLISNAVDAMPCGGKLTIETKIEDGRRKSSLSNLPSSILITVTDTGCGIAKDDLPHIFEPFYTKKSNGTGLGLAICYQIIAEHRGKISASSIINQGSKFIIIIPILK